MPEARSPCEHQKTTTDSQSVAGWQLNNCTETTRIHYAAACTHNSEVTSTLSQTFGQAYACSGEEQEARRRVDELLQQKKWPVYFFESDTTGEKDFEEFFTETEEIDLSRFASFGIIKNNTEFDSIALKTFEKSIASWITSGEYDRNMLIQLFHRTLENFNHKETGKFLDSRM